MSRVDVWEPGGYFVFQDLLYRTQLITMFDSVSIMEVYDYDAYGNTLMFDAGGTGADALERSCPKV